MISPMLEFAGNARDAVNFYAKVFKVTPTIYDAADSSVLHAELPLFGGKLMLCDLPKEEQHHRIVGSNINLSINLADQNELQRLFDQLKIGGTVYQALAPTDWSAAWGLLEDQFEICWQFNLD